MNYTQKLNAAWRDYTRFPEWARAGRVPDGTPRYGPGAAEPRLMIRRAAQAWRRYIALRVYPERARAAMGTTLGRRLPSDVWRHINRFGM